MALRIGGYSLTTPTIATPARIFYTYSCRDPNQKGSPFKSDQRVWESGKYPPTGTDLLDFGPNGRQGMKEAAELRRPLLNIPAPRWRAGTIARFFWFGLREKDKGDRQQRRSPLLRAYRRGRQLPTSTARILGRVRPQCILQIVNFRKGPPFVFKKDRSEP